MELDGRGSRGGRRGPGVGSEMDGELAHGKRRWRRAGGCWRRLLRSLGRGTTWERQGGVTAAKRASRDETAAWARKGTRVDGGERSLSDGRNGAAGCRAKKYGARVAGCLAPLRLVQRAARRSHCVWRLWLVGVRWPANGG